MGLRRQASLGPTLALLAILAALASGCSPTTLAGEEGRSGLPDVTRVDESGGWVSIAESDGDLYISAARDTWFQVTSTGLSSSDQPPAEYTIVRSTESSGFATDARLSPEDAQPVEIVWASPEYGSPMTIELGEESLVIAPSKPVRDIRSVGLADVSGDEVPDLVVLAVGDPGICSDTNTGYVGFAVADSEGRLGEIEWQDPLEGGLASILVLEIDGEPGCEVIAGMVDTFCTGTPAGIWVFSPGPR